MRRGRRNEVCLPSIAGPICGALLTIFDFCKRSIKWLAAADVQNTIKVFSARRNLDSVLAQGCLYLHDYFLTHPAAQAQLAICQEPSFQAEIAQEQERIKQRTEAAKEPIGSNIIKAVREKAQKQ